VFRHPVAFIVVCVCVESQPGHATSMCTGYPNLCCTPNGCGPGNNAPLSPVPDTNGNPVSLNAIQAVLSELVCVWVLPCASRVRHPCVLTVA
jgi:hypothetical protein